MKIVLCPEADNPLIAYEEQGGLREGHFYLDGEGLVRFTHPADGHIWFAAPDLASFRAGVECWEAYLRGASLSAGANRESTIARLRVELGQLGLLPDRPDALWPVLLEQAEAGLL